ncbi:MAG: M3 family oligoendopeptidase [Rhodothermales bacterium]
MSNEHSGAQAVRWNLTDLYASNEALEADLATAHEAAGEFAARYRGNVGALPPDELADALRRFEEIQDRLGRAYTYAYLYWSTDTNDEARGALLQHVRESYTRTSQQLIFFEVEWAKLDDDRASDLLAADALSHYRHYLELERVRKDHLLSEPEERVLSEKSVTGRSAWNRFFDETLGAARFYVDGEELTEQETLSRLHDPGRETRRKAALALTDGLQSHSRPLTYIFNTILADKASDDRLRGYPSWLSSRNMSNEVVDETVEALVDAVTSRYDIVARYYRLKRNLLGYDELFDYDRYAPLGDADTRYTWDEAREIVTDAYASFHPRMAEITRLFFEERWIDAPVQPGKRGGAFSHGAVPSAHPYILLNYTGKPRDVQTLAHELGHGVHQYLSRKQGVLQADTPLTTAEMASVFGEMIVFQRLIRREESATNRLAMLIGKIDDTIATVFRQIAMNRFEDRIHTTRRQAGELTAKQYAEHWMHTQRDMFGGSVTLGEHYRHWWSYIPHFLHSPGYVYAYAFGELLVLAMYTRYKDNPSSFPAAYLDLLEAGGSDWPHVLVGKVGVDMQDPDFWARGLVAIEDLVDEAETLAEQVQDARRE